jgi:predicted nucleic acid-binding protein
MRLFLDANVLFAAAWNPDGAASLLLRLAAASGSRLIASAHAFEEAHRNLDLKRAEALPALEGIRRQVAIVGAAPAELVAWAADGYALPAGDAPILAAAVAARADALVTGDAKHFGQLYGSQCRGVLVLRPRDALSRLLDR